MTEEERERISDILLERMLKTALTYAGTTVAMYDAEFIERCKNFIATKTDEDLVSLLLGGSINVLSTDKLTW